MILRARLRPAPPTDYTRIPVNRASYRRINLRDIPFHLVRILLHCCGTYIL